MIFNQSNLVWLMLKRPDTIVKNENSIKIELRTIFDLNRKTYNINYSDLITVTYKASFIGLFLNIGSIKFKFKTDVSFAEELVVKNIFDARKLHSLIISQWDETSKK